MQFHFFGLSLLSTWPPPPPLSVFSWCQLDLLHLCLHILDINLISSSSVCISLISTWPPPTLLQLPESVRFFGVSSLDINIPSFNFFNLLNYITLTVHRCLYTCMVLFVFIFNILILLSLTCPFIHTSTLF